MNDSYLQHLSDKHTAAPHNEKHTSLSLGARGQRRAARVRAGGAAGQAGGWAKEEGGQILTSPSIRSRISHQELQQLKLKGIKGIARQESPALWNCPPLPSILRFACPINLSSERKGRVTI
jgi:hypothetical protein